MCWKGGGKRRPDGSFFLNVEGLPDSYLLIIEVNYRGLTTTKFIDKLERWISETDEVMVVIGLNLKPNRERHLFAIHVYQYVRSPDNQRAISKYVNEAGQPTFQRHPPNTSITIDLKDMLRRFPELFDSLFEAGHIQPELVVSLGNLLSLAITHH